MPNVNPNFTRVPTGPAALDELDKFKAMLLAALTTGRPAIIRCSGETEAKKLRRRFYSLREQLTAFEREAADCCSFEVIGIRVQCYANKGVVIGDDWTHRVTIGADTNASRDSGDVPPSDRLDKQE